MRKIPCVPSVVVIAVITVVGNAVVAIVDNAVMMVDDVPVLATVAVVDAVVESPIIRKKPLG